MSLRAWWKKHYRKDYRYRRGELILAAAFLLWCALGLEKLVHPRNLSHGAALVGTELLICVATLAFVVFRSWKKHHSFDRTWISGLGFFVVVFLLFLAHHRATSWEFPFLAVIGFALLMRALNLMDKHKESIPSPQSM